MKTVPLADGSGTIPLSASKNPVLGVFRHHCGNIASVHQPKGRKSRLRYLHCSNCGCDQCGGDDYQQRIRQEMKPSIEALETFEAIGSNRTVHEPLKEPLQTNENAVVGVHDVDEEIEPNVTVQTTVTEPLKTVKKEDEVDINKSKRVGLCAVIGGLLGGLLAVVV